MDDTDQVEAAISKCGHFGRTVFEEGVYNITRKMTWDLVSSRVDLHGQLSFKPDIDFWLNAENTFRVVFIQSQASWFVVTGRDFVIDGHSTGGINGNGQPWWSFFATRTRQDGDGRPISLTLWRVTRGTVRNFRIVSPPFWSNAVAESVDVIYDGMYVNASNADPMFKGKNIVPNTDGINTYRSDSITMLNWDITCGDDCLAIKGNSSNIIARNIICRGGNGIAFGSLGQYANMSDNVSNVMMENLLMTRIDPNVQPNMNNGVYFKSWDGTINGSPPTGGGDGPGTVTDVVAKNVVLDRVSLPLHLFQTNGGHSGDAPSILQFKNLNFVNWTGTSTGSLFVDLECSLAVGCPNITFNDFNIQGPAGQTPRFICKNVEGVSGLPGNVCSFAGKTVTC
ncbi:glycoside hydrolase family 28 protein [Amanita thiersii Skay4041]|uniref:galacturonan 1,4-alpha-galacturonidase n=1 Tax=Amanita thiersii Skay4041 TaxID=703135 RepID=A0A2A9NME2_9AGAR|nr:glycoside hydrolase family 28 protein [Amanita thiersii Skay4041]